MAHIEVLDTATANRIAAGEVVERPASIAKELMENALDAGATAITVELREGGIDYLRVTDNGEGFLPGEVKMAFERHATSKLRSGDSLAAIGTLGFRGEALPSIAAVAKVEVTTRRKKSEGGVRLSIEGGRVLDFRDAGCPEGSTMVVRDLFFNTPARKAFLKRASTEGGYVGDAVLHMALARCDVSFRLVNNGKTIYHTPGDGELKRTVQVLFGREIGKDLLEVSGKWAGGTVDGLIGLHDAARANRQREYFTVNGRFVRSPLLALGLEEAARGHIAIGKYPFCVLRVQVPLETVDVNVHPNKLEVRFRDENGMRAALIDIVEQGIRAQEREHIVPLFPPDQAQGETARLPVVDARQSAPAAPPIPPPTASVDSPPSKERLVASEGHAPAAPPPPPPPSEAWPDDADVPPAPAPRHVQGQFAVREIQPVATEMPLGSPYTTVGVLFTTYLVVEQGDAFYLIDQHAAHERLIYEQLMGAQATQMRSQTLLVPYTFDVTPREKEKLVENDEALRAMGFELEDFGPTTLRVAAVPHLLGEPQLKGFFVELVDHLDELTSLRTAALKRDAIATMACKRAVKAGDKLSQSEIGKLLADIQGEQIPLTCPHGRPILLKMTRAELEKRIRRTQ